MNILYINHYAGGPALGMEHRPYYLAKEWVAAGHSVTIVAASFAHTRHANPVRTGAVTHEDIEGIHYVWLKTPEYLGNGVGRMVNMGAFVLALFRHLPEITANWRPEVVITSSTYPLDWYPARRIARKHKAKLVFELHDLWPLTLKTLGNHSRFHPVIMVTQMAEDAWCRECDVAVSLLPRADLHLVTRGLDPRKFVHVPNGVALDEWSDTSMPLPEAHRQFLERAKGAGRFLVGYAGAHGISNALDALIEAGGLLADHPIDIVLIGSGPERERLIAKAQAMNLANVTFLPALPKGAIPTWLSRMDALCLSIQDSPLYRYGVSLNKLFDYMMAARPVISATSIASDLVKEAGCGVSVPAEDPAALAQGILALYQASPQERSDMGARGQRFILANHTYKVLAERFLAALNLGRAHA